MPPIRLLLIVFAFVLFVLGAAAWWSAPDNPRRLSLISAGLAFWVATEFLK